MLGLLDTVYYVILKGSGKRGKILHVHPCCRMVQKNNTCMIVGRKQDNIYISKVVMILKQRRQKNN